MEIILNNPSVAAVENNATVDNKSMVSIRPSEAKPVVWQRSSIGKSYADRPDITIQEVIEDSHLDYNVIKQHLIRVNDQAYDAILHGDPLVGLQLSKDNIISSHCATVDEKTTKLSVLSVVSTESCRIARLLSSSTLSRR